MTDRERERKIDIERESRERRKERVGEEVKSEDLS